MNPFIFDVGMHLGEDTAYYLSRGFFVVGVEADPFLAAHNRQVFSSEISSGRVFIKEGAISAENKKEVIFYKNLAKPFWNTVSKEWSDRNRMLGTNSTEIVVPTISVQELLQKYGTPYYIKIDIEGADIEVLKQLALTKERPEYISLESEKEDFSKLEAEVEQLSMLGYNRFKAVQQANAHRLKIPADSPYVQSKFSFQRGCSGLFGEDLAGPWLSKDEILEYYLSIFRKYQRLGDHSIYRKFALGRYCMSGLEYILNLPLPGWYDTHAKLSET